MILCVGLTPTLQRTLRFDRLTLGEVNRAAEIYTTASGKGVNVARVITRLGGYARALLILGGESGRFVAGTLDAEGVPHSIVWADGDTPTRICTTLLQPGGVATELVEEARSVEPHDAALIDALSRGSLLEARALSLSGSLPPGLSPRFYGELVAEANRLGLPTVIDAQKEPLRLALPQRPLLVKPNREEALATLGLPSTGDAEADARTAITGLADAGAQWALVTMGKSRSLLGNGSEWWRITPPAVDVVNPIGSGDSLAAGFLYAHIVRGMTIPDACRFGTACGSANCLTPISGVVERSDVERLLPDVGLERL